MRLVIWCHISGLYTPVIPRALIPLAEKFIFTSPCSYESELIYTLEENQQKKIAIVSSGTGFVTLQERSRNVTDNIRFGYVGSLNPTKIHPLYTEFLNSIERKDFSVHMWGDARYSDLLIEKCKQYRRPDLITFKGYTQNPDKVLNELDVFIYLLNPNHYGTAENILLEAMSCGVVPIVLNNPAEIALVKHMHNGIVIKNYKEFQQAVSLLMNRPDERERLSRNAASTVKQNFTPEIMHKKMIMNYEKVMRSAKTEKKFAAALGSDPYQWFIASLSSEDFSNISDQKCVQHLILERTKGSLVHFSDYFPENERLKELLKKIKNAH